MKILLLVILLWITNQIVLHLPYAYEVLNFGVNSKWNWTGKIGSILVSALFLMLYRPSTLKDFFLRFKQKSGSLKTSIFVILALLTIQIIGVFLSCDTKAWDLDTLLFQFTMPGLDEEIAYRGIILGLLTKVLKKKVWIFNPAILVSAIWFGLVHGLFISNSGGIILQHSIILTFAMGWIYAWITIKSGSILGALLSHNVNNGVLQFMCMYCL